jgi:aerobic-type carbon monoxide dehydrogenase small subunit (CoxS/CutS family)
VPFAHVRGRKVTTIEGLRRARRLQEAFVAHGGTQCGSCTPGMIVTASVVPPGASAEEIRTALAGNLCRCTGYAGIERAVAASTARAKKAAVGPGFASAGRRRQPTKRKRGA